MPFHPKKNHPSNPQFGCRSVNDSQKELGHLGYIPAKRNPNSVGIEGMGRMTDEDFKKFSYRQRKIFGQLLNDPEVPKQIEFTDGEILDQRTARVMEFWGGTFSPLNTATGFLTKMSFYRLHF